MTDAQQASRRHATVLVAVGHEPWPAARRCLDAVAREARTIGAELLVVTSGSGSDIAREYPEARVESRPGASVFALRAWGLAVAQGERVVITEDHCIVPEGWADRLLTVLQQHPGADAVAPALENGATSRLLDWANFLMWFAPFLPEVIDQGKRLRPPPACNVAVRRHLAEGVVPTEGAFEVQLIPRLWAEGRMVSAPDVVVVHDQSLGPAYTFLHAFHNARSAYAFLAPEARSGPIVARLRSMPGHFRSLLWVVREATSGSEIRRVMARRARLSLAGIALAHTSGTAVAILAGGGRSAKAVH